MHNEFWFENDESPAPLSGSGWRPLPHKLPDSGNTNAQSVTFWGPTSLPVNLSGGPLRGQLVFRSKGRQRPCVLAQVVAKRQRAFTHLGSRQQSQHASQSRLTDNMSVGRLRCSKTERLSRSSRWLPTGIQTSEATAFIFFDRKTPRMLFWQFLKRKWAFYFILFYFSMHQTVIISPSHPVRLGDEPQDRPHLFLLLPMYSGCLLSVEFYSWTETTKGSYWLLRFFCRIIIGLKRSQ